MDILEQDESAETSLREYISQRSQHTLKSSATFTGVGIHSGQKTTITVNPCPENAGIFFVKNGAKQGENLVEALWNKVVDTHLCTVISNDFGNKVATIEHLMAALAACQIDNAAITIDGDEVPTMDGSSKEFIETFEEVGYANQNVYRKEIIILDEIQISRNDKWAKIEPYDGAMFNFEIDFEKKNMDKQHYQVELTKDNFIKEISQARTFGFFEEVSQLRKLGFAKGGSLNNAIVVKHGKVLNNEGLRFPDEFVRHKILDAIGDLYLAGCPIRGRFTGNCSGHSLNNQLLRLLFADVSSFCYN